MTRQCTEPLDIHYDEKNGVYGPPSGVNQYTSVSGHTLAYDANFNLSGYDAWSYVYDADKRLISASGSGTAMGQGHSAQFVYDGLGRCVKRTIDNVTTLITYDGWKPVAEWNGAGGLVAWNLYGPGADEILVRYDVGATKHVYYHLDAQGHVQFLLDGNGDVLDKYTYDAFGQPKIMDGNGTERATTSNGNRFLFTGREYLSALGLMITGIGSTIRGWAVSSRLIRWACKSKAPSSPRNRRPVCSRWCCSREVQLVRIESLPLWPQQSD